jgi:hypothetical protein
MEAGDASPIERARIATEAGAKLFQIALPLSRTSGQPGSWVGTKARVTPIEDAAYVLQGIEDEGWRLENVGYVYRSTTTDSTHGTIGSSVVSGDIVGIYIFRRVASAKTTKERSESEPPVEVEMGCCPNCAAFIPLLSQECFTCRAQFGGSAAWRVKTLRRGDA